MEKKEHPYAQVLRWVADGERIEARRQSKVAPVDWTSTSHAEVLSIIRYGETGWEFRLKPTPMCELAGIRFPVPMKESPEEVEEIWVAATDGHFLDILGPSEFDKYRRNNRLVRLIARLSGWNKQRRLTWARWQILNATTVMGARARVEYTKNSTRCQH